MSQEDRARLMREDIQTNSDKVLPRIGGHHGTDGDGKSNKKKYIIIGVIAGVVVLALVLGLTLSGGSDDKPDPGPTPPSPGGNGYNPYKVEGGSEMIQGSGQSVMGLIQADKE